MRNPKRAAARRLDARVQFLAPSLTLAQWRSIAARRGESLGSLLRRGAELAVGPNKKGHVCCATPSVSWPERYRQYYEDTEALLSDATLSIDARLDVQDRHELLGRAISEAVRRRGE